MRTENSIKQKLLNGFYKKAIFCYFIIMLFYFIIVVITLVYHFQ